MTVTVALLQLESDIGALEKNLARIRSAVGRAAEHGARLAVTPQMALVGHPLDDLARRESFQRAAGRALTTLAAGLVEDGHGDVTVLVGTLGVDGGRLTDRAVALRGGAVVGTYDKRVLATSGPFDEGRTLEPGNAPLTLEIDGARVGVLIGTDADGDDLPGIAAGAGLEVAGSARLDGVVVLAASPFEDDVQQVREEHLSSQSARLGCPIAFANRVGGQDHLVFDGGSLVAAPVAGEDHGVVAARAGQFRETELVVTLGAIPEGSQGTSADAIAVIAGDGPAGSSTTDPEAPMSRAEATYRACTVGLRDYARQNGFRSVVLGLSGGIDSALVAAMAADALGGQHIIGISMPSTHSSDHSKDDAADTARRLGVDYRTVPIAPIVDAFQGQLPLEGVPAENLQARVRGMILMAVSNAEGPLCLATGNKTELAVGYSTIYGDAVGGYAPIKDVLKTRVWELSRWRNEHARARGEVEPIPENSITKPPSAELSPGQMDSDSLPPYDVLDPVVSDYVDNSLGRAELLAAGHDPATVDRVVGLVDRAEWKRRQYPLGPRVSASMLGVDRRLPLTSAWREPAEQG